MRDLVSRHRRHVRAKVKSNHIHSERCKDLQNPEEILVNQTAQHPDSSEQQYESDNEGLYEKEKRYVQGFAHGILHSQNCTVDNQSDIVAKWDEKVEHVNNGYGDSPFESEQMRDTSFHESTITELEHQIDENRGSIKTNPDNQNDTEPESHNLEHGERAQRKKEEGDFEKQLEDLEKGFYNSHCAICHGNIAENNQETSKS